MQIIRGRISVYTHVYFTLKLLSFILYEALSAFLSPLLIYEFRTLWFSWRAGGGMLHELGTKKKVIISWAEHPMWYSAW